MSNELECVQVKWSTKTIGFNSIIKLNLQLGGNLYLPLCMHTCTGKNTGMDHRALPFFFVIVGYSLFFFILQQPSVASLPQCFMMDPDKWKRRREKEIEDAVRSQLPRRERRPVRSLSVNTYIVLFVSPCFYFLLWHRRSSWRHDYHTRKRIQRPASLTLIVWESKGRNTRHSVFFVPESTREGGTRSWIPDHIGLWLPVCSWVPMMSVVSCQFETRSVGSVLDSSDILVVLSCVKWPVALDGSLLRYSIRHTV